MDPLTIGVLVGGQAISGLVQYYNAEKARGASSAELKKIETLFNNIKPPDYDLSIDAPPAYHTEAVQSPKFAASIQSPKFDMSKFSPEKLAQVAQYVPTMAPLIKEAAPQLIQNSETMQKGRAAQIKALEKLTQIGEGGFDPEYAQKVQTAARQAQSEAQSRQESLMDSFARRGIGGSGLELAAAMSGNAQAMDRSAMANQQAATDAYRNQMQALAQSADLGGQLFSQDQNLQGTNAGIINAFNQRMSAAQQNWEQRRAQEMNDAQVRNLSEQQRIADANTNNTNVAAMADRSRMDDLTKFGYNAAVQQQGRGDQLAQDDYSRRVNERGYQNTLADSIAQWKSQQKDKQNTLKTQMFNNDMNKASGLAGRYQGNAQNILQQAADRNQAISGLSGAASNIAMGYQASQDKQADRDWRESMAKKYGYSALG